MDAIRFYEYGGPDVLRFEEDVPEPQLRPGTVLVQSTSAGVNPIDWKIRSGSRRGDIHVAFPSIPGKDVSGIVLKTGSDVTNVHVGDRVIANASATYAQFVAVAAELITPLPDGLDQVDAAALPLPIITGEQLVRVAAHVKPGQTVLISGALGSVGRCAVHAVNRLGARAIAAVRAGQLDEARRLDVSGVVAIDDEEALQALPAIDAVADTVGGTTGGHLLEVLRPGGFFGYASVLPDDAQQKYPQIKIARVWARPDPKTVGDFAVDLRDGKFALPVTARLPLKQAAQAQARLEAGGGGKVVLEVS